MSRTVASAASRLLLEHGPLTLAELHALALDEGATRAKSPTSLSASLSSSPYVVRPDGRYDTAARLLRGQVFTTRPRSVADRVLWTSRDLDPLQALPGLPLSRRRAMTPGRSAAESWTGPAGWLPAVPPGALLGLR